MEAEKGGGYGSERQAPGYYDRREQWGPPPPMVPQRPRVLGPCFQCGGYGHIAKFCSDRTRPNRPYSFSQPVVSSAEVHEPSPGLDELSLCCDSVSGVIDKSATHSVCVNELVGIDQVMSKESVDGQSHEHASDDKVMSDNKMNSEITQFWELES